jgi:Protein of unknown function (DUF3501)
MNADPQDILTREREQMASVLTLQDLPALADYTRERERFRAEVLAAKKARYVAIGENVSLLFESRLTVLYQVMEMLRIEKTTDASGIQAELDAYNPMIPGGNDWRATMLIEFEDADERRVQLKYMRHVEHHVYADIGEIRVAAVADEDMERSDAEKTSSVHFLRFPLPPEAVAALRAGARLAFGIDHPRYRFTHELTDPAVIASLADDLN